MVLVPSGFRYTSFLSVLLAVGRCYDTHRDFSSGASEVATWFGKRSLTRGQALWVRGIRGQEFRGAAMSIFVIGHFPFPISHFSFFIYGNRPWLVNNSKSGPDEWIKEMGRCSEK